MGPNLQFKQNSFNPTSELGFINLSLSLSVSLSLSSLQFNSHTASELRLSEYSFSSFFASEKMAHNLPKHQNGVPYLDPQQPIISVAPLNSVPYTGPPLVPNDSVKNKKNNGPAMVFLPSCPDEENTKNILSSSRGGVILTGSAALGKVGPLIGSLDIGENEDMYIFRVSLPGGLTDRNRFSCEVDPSGKAVIKGVTTTGEKIIRKHSQVFEMKTQNLCPPGEFSATFTLPGPVDHQTFSGSFYIDGILVGKIKKKRAGEAL